MEEAFEQCAMAMFGYMTDTETVEPIDTIEVESEGEMVNLIGFSLETMTNRKIMQSHNKNMYLDGTKDTRDELRVSQRSVAHMICNLLSEEGTDLDINSVSV